MYGTIARLHVNPGTDAALTAHLREFDALQIAGAGAAYLYRTDAAADICYLVVVFESKETYLANARSPEQDARYRQLEALLADAPEWHDGEILYASEVGASGL